MSNYIKLLPCLLFCIFFRNSYAQKVILTKSEKQLSIAHNIWVYKYNQGEIPFHQAKDLKYELNKRRLLHFPFSDNSYWLKVDFENQDPTQTHWMIEWDHSMTEHVDFYVPDQSGKYSVSKMGALAQQKFRYFEFWPKVDLYIKKGESKSVYIHVRSDRGFTTSVFASTPQVYEKEFLIHIFTQGIIIGLVFLRLFYILFISFFAVKESVFRKYSVLQIFRSLAFLGLNSILGGIFFKDIFKANLVNYLSQSIIPIFIVIMVRAILPKEKIHPIINYLFHFVFYSTIILTGALLIDFNWLWMKIGIYTFILFQLFILGLFAYAFLKKWKFDSNYSIPFLLSMLSYVFVHLRMVGLADSVIVISIAYLFFIFEIFIFGFFLGRIIKNYEKSRAASEQQLIFTREQTQKLKELDSLKTTFFTNISHEIRTPLTLITGPFKQLAEKYPSDKSIPIIQRNTDRLLKLVNQLLDISKLEAGQKKPEIIKHNITEYLRTLVSSFSSLAESRGISFGGTFSKTEQYGYIDRDKLEKIVTNLLSNAFKFTPQGGNVEFKEFFDSSTTTLTIEVSDTGIGIDPKKLDKIYDRFYQIDDAQNRNYEGTGIGLALVKELVELLKGRISVKSELTVGTTFVVELPVDFFTWKDYINDDVDETTIPKIDYNTTTKLRDIDLITKEPENEKLLLIIDDNEDIRIYLRSIFENEYKIIEAVNGKDGILKASEQIPNIIISDLMMPEMDGFEFCKHLKTDEKTSHIPIVMLTAKANIESRIEGFELGADDYLLKPFNSTEIQVRVKNLLEKQERLSQYFGKDGLNTKPVSPTVNPLEVAFIAKAKAVVERNLSHSEFNAEQFSEDMNLSQSQLLRKLKALTNLTIVEFIRQYRLQRAAAMLVAQEKAVSEIALEVGFENMSYFSKVFQEEFGVVPSEYRG